jgi:hypothetical protein
MSKQTLNKLKTRMGQEIALLGRKGSGSISFEAVIAALRRKHPKDIRAAADDLETIALQRLYYRIADGRPKVDERQGDFWSEYKGVPRTLRIVAVASGKRVASRRLVTKMMVDEVELWLDSGPRQTVTRRERNPGLVEMVADVKPYAPSPATTTIEQAFKAKVEAEKIA